MTISQSFYTAVSGNSNITDELASVNTIFASVLPAEHDGFPALTFEKSGDDDIDKLDGTVNELHLADFEVNCWAKSALGAANVAAVVKTEILGMRYAAFGANTADQIIKTSEIGGLFEPSTGLHRVRLVFRIAYS